MTRICVADEQLGQIARRQHDLFRRVREGTLDVQVVLDGLQRLIEPATATPTLPTSFTAGSRTYGIMPFLEKGGDPIAGREMVKRSVALAANLGEEDGRHILAHQSDIPASFRGKIVMVFPEWRDPDGPDSVAYLDWDGDGWVLDWYWLDVRWGGIGRLLRRTA